MTKIVVLFFVMAVALTALAQTGDWSGKLKVQGTGNRIVSVEGVNHLFQHCPTGNPSEYKDIEESFAPEALTLIIEWLSSYLAP